MTPETVLLFSVLTIVLAAAGAAAFMAVRALGRTYSERVADLRETLAGEKERHRRLEQWYAQRTETLERMLLSHSWGEFAQVQQHAASSVDKSVGAYTAEKAASEQAANGTPFEQAVEVAQNLVDDDDLGSDRFSEIGMSLEEDTVG